MSGELPPELYERIGITPAEEVVVELLRDRIPEVSVQHQFEFDQVIPVILVRRNPNFGQYQGDPRFLDSASLAIQVVVGGVNAEQDAALLGHHINKILYEESRKRRVIPGKGHLVSSNMTSSPRRSPDWATADGPVQYADLPSQTIRYETLFDVTVRKVRSH